MYEVYLQGRIMVYTTSVVPLYGIYNFETVLRRCLLSVSCLVENSLMFSCIFITLFRTYGEKQLGLEYSDGSLNKVYNLIQI